MVAVQIRMALPQSSNEPGSGMSGKGAQLVLTCFIHPLDGDKFKLRHEL